MNETLYNIIYFSKQNAYHLNLIKTIIIYIYTIVLPIPWRVYTAKLQESTASHSCYQAPSPFEWHLWIWKLLLLVLMLTRYPVDRSIARSVVACASVDSIPSR